MNRPRHLSAIAVLAEFVLGAFPCAAQDGENISLQFLSFPRSIDPKPVQLLVGEGETIEVQIPSNELSAPHKVKRMASWSVVEPVIGEDGEPTFKMLGTAGALASPKQLIILVRKGKENSDGFDVIPIDAQISQFGGGKFLFMNASRIDIGGVVGAERFSIRPGQHTIIEPKPESPGGRLCHAALYYPRDGAAKSFFSSKWPLSEYARGLIFVYQDPATARLRLHSIRDFF